MSHIECESAQIVLVWKLAASKNKYVTEAVTALALPQQESGASDMMPSLGGQYICSRARKV